MFKTALLGDSLRRFALTKCLPPHLLETIAESHSRLVSPELVWHAQPLIAQTALGVADAF